MVNLTEAQHQKLMERASFVNLSVSELVMTAVLRRTPIKARVPGTDIQALNKLSRIGVNINRIVRVMESEKGRLFASRINIKELYELRDLLKDVREKLRHND